MKLTPGEQIVILVDGQPVETVIDEHGTQRFIENGVVSWLFDNGKLDLNSMGLAFSRGDFSLDAYMEFYMSLGYTVCGFQAIFGEHSDVADQTGQPVEILNPVWESEVVTIH